MISLKPWTTLEDQRLEEIYPTATNMELMREFNRTMEAIRGRAHRLKIRRSSRLISETLKNRAKARWSRGPYGGLGGMLQ